MKFQPTPVASAIALALVAMSSVAQADDAPKSDAQSVETITITGIRGSMKTAAAIKQNATAVVDAISAEDIGKLPDSDVGETLGRVAGVSVGRAFGQGASVSVRGSDPQMTYTTLNGQTIASTGWYDQQSIDRSFNYSLLPSDLVGGIEVYKSSQADLTEGGIGGTVIVKTRKPLDLPANTGFASATMGKGTISGASDELAGLYSWKNDSNNFGVLVSGGTGKENYIRRGVESDNRWAADVEPTAFVQDRKRNSLDVHLQAKPVQGLDLGFEYLGLSLTGDNSNTSYYIFQEGGPGGVSNCTHLDPSVISPIFNPNGMCFGSTTTAANASQTFLQTWARKAKMTSDSYNFDAHYRVDNVKFDAVVGQTKADGGTSETTNYQYYGNSGGANMPTWTGTIDATGHQININPTSNQTVTMANLPQTAGPQGTWATSQGPNHDKENYGQLDATINLDLGAIRTFKTGFRLTDHTFEKNSLRALFAATPINAQTSSLYDGTLDMVGGFTVPKPNIDAMMSNTNANITKWVTDRSGYGKLEEKNTALYGMFTFEADNMRGNFGLRYISSKVSADGYAFDGTMINGDIGNNSGWNTNIVEKDANYHDVLPSVNTAFTLKDNLILRATAAQALTRPNYDNMFLVSEAGYGDKQQDQQITYGDPSLKPMKSSQADLGLEYYYGKGNLLSATYFIKDISNFITTQTAVNQHIGIVNPGNGLDSWQINRYINAGGGMISGLELQSNQAFDNGFGYIANYTFAEATAPAASFADDLGLFTLSSKHNVNLVGYYETSDYFARLAYNWRSKYMVRETGWYSNRMHDAYGQLDLSLGWNVAKNIKLTFEAANLLKQDDIQYGVAAGNDTLVRDPLRDGYPAWSFKGETTYKVGISAKF